MTTVELPCLLNQTAQTEVSLSPNFSANRICSAAELLVQAYAEFGLDYEPSSGGLYLTSADKQKIRELTEEGQMVMDIRHGTGYPDYYFDEGVGVKNLGHNTGQHGRAFGEDAQLLAIDLDQSEAAYTLWSYVGVTHDFSQNQVINKLPRNGEDERASLRWSLRRLISKGVSVCAVEFTAYATEATVPIVNKHGQVVNQFGKIAPRELYPSDELWIAARMAPDADLGRVFSVEGLRSSRKLLAQREGYTPHESVAFGEGARASLRGQYEFMRKLTYSFEESEILFASHRRIMLEHASKLADQADHIKSWEQVEDLDHEFAVAHRLEWELAA